MHKLIKISFSLGMVTFITLLAAVIKTKFWAVYLGPNGVGIISQIYNYQLFLTLLASFGFAQGITKYVSEYVRANDNNAAAHVLNTSLSVSIAISLALVIGTIILSPFVSDMILGDKRLFLLVMIAVLGVPFQVTSEACLAFLQGYQGVKQIVRANIMSALLTLASAVPLILFFQIRGAAVHLMLTGVITYFAFHLQVKGISTSFRLINIKNLKHIFYSELLKKLVNFGFLRLLQMALGSVSLLIVRSLVIRFQGAAQNGLYQAASNFSIFFIPVILNVLWSYFYSDFCRAGNNESLNAGVNSSFHYTILISLPIIIVILLLRYPLIHLVYSQNFRLVALLLPLQLLGDFFRVMCMPLSAAMVSREMLTHGVWYEFIWNAFFVIAAVLLLPYFGVSILLIAYVAAYLLNFIMFYFHLRHFNNFYFSARNLIIVVNSLFLILVSGFLPLKKFPNLILFALLTFSWIIFSLPYKTFRKTFRGLFAAYKYA